VSREEYERLKDSLGELRNLLTAHLTALREQNPEMGRAPAIINAPIGDQLNVGQMNVVTIQVVAPNAADLSRLQGDALIDLLATALDASGAKAGEGLLLALGETVFGDRRHPESMGLIAPNKKEGVVLTPNQGSWGAAPAEVALTTAALHVLDGAYDGLNAITRRQVVTAKENEVYIRATDVMAPLDAALRGYGKTEEDRRRGREVAAKLVGRQGPLFGVAVKNAAIIRQAGGRLPKPGDPAELRLPPGFAALQ
jgi:hypothetical protein